MNSRDCIDCETTKTLHSGPSRNSILAQTAGQKGRSDRPCQPLSCSTDGTSPLCLKQATDPSFVLLHRATQQTKNNQLEHQSLCTAGSLVSAKLLLNRNLHRYLVSLASLHFWRKKLDFIFFLKTKAFREAFRILAVIQVPPSALVVKLVGIPIMF